MFISISPLIHSRSTTSGHNVRVGHGIKISFVSSCVSGVPQISAWQRNAFMDKGTSRLNKISFKSSVQPGANSHMKRAMILRRGALPNENWQEDVLTVHIEWDEALITFVGFSGATSIVKPDF